MIAQGLADARSLEQALAPWSSGKSFLNFTESRMDTRRAFDRDSFVRLGNVRATVDPEGVFVANHQIPVAGGGPS